MEQSTYANSPPKAPAQKAQQGVSVRKCNRSTQPKNRSYEKAKSQSKKAQKVLNLAKSAWKMVKY